MLVLILVVFILRFNTLTIVPPSISTSNNNNDAEMAVAEGTKNSTNPFNFWYDRDPWVVHHFFNSFFLVVSFDMRFSDALLLAFFVEPVEVFMRAIGSTAYAVAMGSSPSSAAAENNEFQKAMYESSTASLLGDICMDTMGVVTGWLLMRIMTRGALRPHLWSNLSRNARIARVLFFVFTLIPDVLSQVFSVLETPIVIEARSMLMDYIETEDVTIPYVALGHCLSVTCVLMVLLL
jgi:hypothetical protein